MTFKTLLTAAAVLAGSGPAFSWDQTQSTKFAVELGSVLAAEQICDLRYDQAAITALIEKTVPAEDMGFAGTLTMMTDGTAYDLEDASASKITAFCTQQRRVARTHGFID